jgi:hypothetical protein
VPWSLVDVSAAFIIDSVLDDQSIEFRARLKMMHGGYSMFSIVVGGIVTIIFGYHYTRNHPGVSSVFHAAFIPFCLTGAFTTAHLMCKAGNRFWAGAVIDSLFCSFFV